MPDVSMDTLIQCAAMLKADIESAERELRKVQREIRRRRDEDLVEQINEMANKGGPRL